jgi:hypothetical protein
LVGNGPSLGVEINSNGKLSFLTTYLELLEPVTLSLVDDFWRWVPDPDGIFSVSSAYNLLVKELLSLEVPPLDVAVVFLSNLGKPRSV